MGGVWTCRGATTNISKKMASALRTKLDMTVLAALVLITALPLASSQQYFGKRIGSLSRTQHDVKGEVYAVDSRTIHIKGFSYDGTAPDAFFYAGKSGLPSDDGFIIPDENGSTKPLGHYNNKDVTLTLPEGVTLKNVKWLSIWCRAFGIDFGQLVMPQSLQYPRPQKINGLSTLDHGVKSDRIVVVDAQTFLIPNFHYDGSAPGGYNNKNNGNRNTHSSSKSGNRNAHSSSRSGNHKSSSRYSSSKARSGLGSKSSTKGRFGSGGGSPSKTSNRYNSHHRSNGHGNRQRDDDDDDDDSMEMAMDNHHSGRHNDVYRQPNPFSGKGRSRNHDSEESVFGRTRSNSNKSSRFGNLGRSRTNNKSNNGNSGTHFSNNNRKSSNNKSHRNDHNRNSGHNRSVSGSSRNSKPNRSSNNSKASSNKKQMSAQELAAKHFFG